MPSEKTHKENATHRSHSHSSRSTSSPMEYGKVTRGYPGHIQNNGYGNAVMQSMSSSPNIQLKKDEEENVQLKEEGSKAKENNTGLPDDLKAGVENLSGISMNDVKVHYNSDKPAQMQAHAYAQGTDIHMAPGQEKHLPHEAWHVVQQKQGRVQPTMQMKNKVDVNDDDGLEHEADVIGKKAIQVSSSQLPVQKKENTLGTKVVQRNKKSTKVLKAKNMAEPKVGQQNIELAMGIHDDLEKIYNEEMKVDQMDDDIARNHYNGAVCLGGIILPPMRGYKNLKKLIKSCEMVNIGKGAMKRGIYELLNEDLKKRIIANTLATMEQANQLEYLKESGFAGEEDTGWKVVVEVHYYRERPTENNVFHKDTLGTTLFVNLNYLNKKKVIGPEYVVNPAENKDHMANIAESLPKEFLKDRKTVMSQLKEPEIIDVVEIPEYGFVSFVDEAINHSSPTTEHRKVKGSDIHKYLKANNAKYDTYKAAYGKWSNQMVKLKKFKSYLPAGEKTDGLHWLDIFKHIEDGDSLYDRNQIRFEDKSQAVLKDADIDLLVHMGAHENFGQVSIPKVDRSNMTTDDRPLKRRMSMILDSDNDFSKDKESGGRRSFFRTWVRAERVKTVEEDILKPNWKWDQQTDMKMEIATSSSSSSSETGEKEKGKEIS